MEEKDLLPIIFERSNASTTLWNIEFAVILGAITFMATAKPDRQQWLVRLALTVLFLCAQFFNCRALRETSVHRQILRGIFESLPNSDVVNRFKRSGYNVDPLRYSTPSEIIGVFVLASLAGTLFIWLYPG